MNSDYIRQRLLKEQTPYESKLYAVLDTLDVQYIPQHVFPYGDTFIVCDVFLPYYDIVIELDGLHHILSLEQCAKDTARDKYLLDTYSIKVIRYLNSVVNDTKLFKKIIEDLINPLKQTKLVD